MVVYSNLVPVEKLGGGGGRLCCCKLSGAFVGLTMSSLRLGK